MNILKEKIKADILSFLLRENLSFSLLLRKTGLRDHGQLNYHLKILLKEGIIEKERERYKVTILGERLGVYLQQFLSKETYPVSVVAPIIYDEMGRILMVRRAINPQKDRLGFPGGKIVIGETLMKAAEREVFEETGLKLKAKKVLGFIPSVVYKENALSFHVQLIPILMETINSQAKIKLDEKHKDYSFVSIKELDKYPIIPHNANILKQLDSNKFLFKEMLIKE